MRLEGDLVQIVLSMAGVVTALVAYMLLIFGVYKLFTIAHELGEIKKLLRDLGREREGLSRRVPETALRE